VTHILLPIFGARKGSGFLPLLAASAIEGDGKS